jgi:hypothetical protein
MVRPITVRPITVRRPGSPVMRRAGLWAGVAILGASTGAVSQSPSAITEFRGIPPGTAMTPGTYEILSSGTHIAFRIGDAGWRGEIDIPEIGFAIAHEDVQGGLLSVVPYTGVLHESPCEPSTTSQVVSASSFIDRVSQAPGVQAVAPASSVTLGGLRATRLDLETVAVADRPDGSLAWEVPSFGEFYFSSGTRVRLIAVDIGGQTLVVAAEAPEGSFDQFIGHAQAVIDSLAFGIDGEPSVSPGSRVPSGAAAGPCTIALDRVPAWVETFFLSGTGFLPGVDVGLTFIEPAKTNTWGGPDGVAQPEGLRTGDDGAFGPYDIEYVEPKEEDFGDSTTKASDGECVASVSFTLGPP